jgi:hypothetical protein
LAIKIFTVFTFSAIVIAVIFAIAFLLRAVNQLTTAPPKAGGRKGGKDRDREKRGRFVLVETEFIHGNGQLNCHLPLRCFSNYNFFFAVSGNRIERQYYCSTTAISTSWELRQSTLGIAQRHRTAVNLCNLGKLLRWCELPFALSKHD